MTTLSVTCACGQVLRVDASHAGLAIRCRSCGRTLRVHAPGAIGRARRTVQRAAGAPAGAWNGMRGLVRRNARLLRYLGEAALPLQVTAVLSWLWVLAVAGVAAFMWAAGDRNVAATVVLYSGRWVWLVPLLVLVPLAWFTARELLLPLTLGVVCVLGPLMGLRTGWQRVLPVGSGPVVRVVTLNTAQRDAVGDALPQLLAEWRPDVVAMQECGERLVAITRRMAGWFHHDTTGLCLLSRHPIRSVEVMDRSSLERVREDTLDRIGGAGFVVRYAIDGRSGLIGLTNLHLETARKGFEALSEGSLRRYALNAELRDIESRRARAWVNGGPGPWLVVGDFNLPPESRIFREHWGDLADAFSAKGMGFGYTRYNGWIRIRIDHVLAGEGWRVKGAWVGRDVGSDHRPLIVDLLRGSR